ncbi:SdpI family protein [Eubacteriales bacterium OttesenSCG-928-M02]|nr:SdpI family protein [Eubacteriales bacterium OttesenSCG-928-M02]
MLGFGLFWKNHPPKFHGSFFGYRTGRSERNPSSWYFAHHCIACIWRWVGGISTFLTFLCFFLLWSWSINAVASLSLVLTAFAMVLLFYSVLPTERALKKYYTPSGYPKASSDIHPHKEAHTWKQSI